MMTVVFYADSKPDRVVCVDPSWQEESLMDGKIVFGVNPYREICTLHLAGNMLIDKVKKRRETTWIFCNPG